MKTTHYLLSCFSFLFAITYSGCTSNTVQEAERPNILLILADDMGYQDAGFQGSEEILTPNLDALASNGIIFTDAHVTASVCSPSRAGLLTGRYQQYFGHEANVPPPGMGTDTTQIMMAETLRKAGYTTSINGKWHQGDTYSYHPNSRGFDHFWGFLGGHRDYFATQYPEGHQKAIYTNRKYTPFEGEYLTDTQADTAIAFIERNKEEPFFLFMSFAAPHAPMHALEEDMALFPDSDRPEYAAMVYALDRAIGNIIQKLKDIGKYENTLIVFLSDNGGSPANDSDNAPLKGFKGNKFDGGLKVPFLIHWPARLEGGQVFDGLTSSLDLFPTFLAAVGKESTPELSLDGINLLPYLDGSKKGDPHEQLFFRKEIAAAVRDGDWKLIRLDDRDGDYEYVLYDLSTDPYEKDDLIKKETARFNKMKAALENWEEKTVVPWWDESRKWQEVTIDIHEDLMNNQPIRRISPN